jgi:hypothetical protein
MRVVAGGIGFLLSVAVVRLEALLVRRLSSGEPRADLRTGV